RALYIMDWAPVKTRTSNFLLPQHAEMWMFLSDGQIHRNDIALAQCREYRAESSIRFDMEETDYAAPEPADGSPGIAAASFLPPGVTLELQLREALDLAALSVGDVFLATLAKPARHRGRVLLPQGAEVEGRIRRLDHYKKPRPHTVVWLEFPFLRDGHTEYTFLADLVKRDALPGLVDEVPGTVRRPTARSGSIENYESLGSVEPGYRSVPGVGSFIFADELPPIPVGYTLEWKTVAATP
ncbi:MAG: hypothetical protein KIT83_21875, partial [Bryobacterales bacterium]|nr:hypothetical protein [Bryobacterales bacterium]